MNYYQIISLAFILVGIIVRLEISVAVLKANQKNLENNLKDLLNENKSEHREILQTLEKLIFTKI